MKSGVRILPRLSVALVMVAGACGVLGGAYREFTDQQGRSMQAKLLQAYGLDRVELEREDGQRFVVSPEVFSAEDQRYIEDWVKRQVLAEREILRVSTLTRYGRKSRDDTHRGLVVERYPGYYRVTLENRSDLDFQDLTVEYRTFIFKNDVAANRRGEGRVMREEGKHTVKSLSARQKVEFNTDEVELVDTSLQPGFYWGDGGRAKSSDRMDGIWLRIMRKDEIIVEYASPTALPERQDW